VTCCTTSTSTNPTRCTHAMPGGAHRPSPRRSGARSRSLPCPGRSTTTWPSRPGAWPSWRPRSSPVTRTSRPRRTASCQPATPPPGRQRTTRGGGGWCRAVGGGPPIPAHMGAPPAGRPTTSAATGCMAASSRASGAGRSWSSCGVSAHPVPARRAAWDRAGQLQPASAHQGRRSSGRLVGSQQRRAGLYPNQCLVAEPDRGPVPGAAVLHPRRH
jgi:hypothetical protein